MVTRPTRIPPGWELQEDGKSDRQRKASAIRPLNLPTLRTGAAEQLRSLIESSHFAPGDRLPSERELATRLGISRTLLREAMSTLEALGLIEIRRGSGSYVTSRPFDPGLSALWSAWYDTHRNELIHLLQVREMLETKAASLAVDRISPPQLHDLRTSLDAMHEAVARGDARELGRLDAVFHHTIIGASGNPIIVQLLFSLDSVLDSDRIAVFSQEARRQQSLRDHKQILAALEQRDRDMVSAALEQHFENVLHDLERGNENQEAISEP